MNRYLLWILAVLSLQCQGIDLRQPATLSYEIRVVPNQNRIDITGSLKGLGSGSYYFVLPQTQGQPARHFIQNLGFRDADGPIGARPTLPNEWAADVKSDSISFSYQINVHNLAVYQDEAWGGAISQIDDRMAFLSGGMSFVIPLLDEIEQPIAIRWRVPDSWHVVTPWSIDKSVTTVPSQYGLIRNYYVAFAGGSILHRRIRNMDVSMVWLGRDDINRFTDMELATQRVIDAAISLFDGPATREHLTLILRDTNAGNRFRASTESNSIEFNFKKGISFEHLWRNHRNGFLRLLAHEIMHTWDRREVKTASEYLSVREWGPDTCWLREGFTEYFANLTLYEAGIYNRDKFVKAMRELSDAAHHIHKSAKFTLLEACSPFFADNTSMRYVYTEGASLAFWLDLETRRATGGEKSLPLFMRDFMESYRYQEKTVEAFLSEWKAYAPAHLAEFKTKLTSPTPVVLTRAIEGLNW